MGPYRAFFRLYSPTGFIQLLCEKYYNTRKRQHDQSLILINVHSPTGEPRCDAIPYEIREHRSNGRDTRKGGREGLYVEP